MWCESATKRFPWGLHPIRWSNRVMASRSSRAQRPVLDRMVTAAGSKAGLYRSSVKVVSGEERSHGSADPAPLGIDLPEVSHFRSMVLVAPSTIKRFYPTLSSSTPSDWLATC